MKVGLVWMWDDRRDRSEVSYIIRRREETVKKRDDIKERSQ